jgi:hypothetical protein
MSGLHRTGWVRATTRAAIYTRDCWTCCWCGAAVNTHGLVEPAGWLSPDVVLTLDHLRGAGVGGTNHPNNLVTACWECNTNRGEASVLTMLSWLDAGGKDVRLVRARLRQRRLALSPFRVIGRVLEHERPFWYRRHKAMAGAEGMRRRLSQGRLSLWPGEVHAYPAPNVIEPVVAAMPF